MITNDNDNDKFKDHLNSSHKSVWFMAQYFWLRGYWVNIPPTDVTPDYSQRMNYVDGGDLYVCLPPNETNRYQRVEIKQLSRNFESRETWPFGDRFIVCAKHSYDNATPKPFAYYILSQDYKTVAIVPTTQTFSTWYTDVIKDNRYTNSYQTYYLTNTNNVYFRSIDTDGMVF